MPRRTKTENPQVVAFSELSKKQQKELLARTKPLSVALRDQAKNFYMAVGQGISHWSKMEGRLVQVAAKLLKTSELKAGLVMYSIINLNVWIQIIDDPFCVRRNISQIIETVAHYC